MNGKVGFSRSQAARGAFLGAILCFSFLPAGGRPVQAQEVERKITLNFAGLDLATVARQVERVTKKSFVFDENLLRSKRLTLQSETPITPEEFYRVFQGICQMEGLILVSVEGAGIALEKIVRSNTALKEPGAHPTWSGRTRSPTMTL